MAKAVAIRRKPSANQGGGFALNAAVAALHAIALILLAPLILLLLILSLPLIASGINASVAFKR